MVKKCPDLKYLSSQKSCEGYSWVNIERWHESKFFSLYFIHTHLRCRLQSKSRPLWPNSILKLSSIPYIFRAISRTLHFCVMVDFVLKVRHDLSCINFKCFDKDKVTLNYHNFHITIKKRIDLLSTILCLWHVCNCIQCSIQGVPMKICTPPKSET